MESNKLCTAVLIINEVNETQRQPQPPADEIIEIYKP